MLLDTDMALPTEEIYKRNLIGGRWVFPAAPYEFEIRSPANSAVIAEVPLSSRFDVRTAIEAASEAAVGDWTDSTHRISAMATLLDLLESRVAALAELQVVESGLSEDDSRATVDAALRLARSLLGCGSDKEASRRGVSGHVISWGLPFTEMLSGVFMSMLRGNAVVVKPSLRGPLSPVAFALAATQAGLPPGVINIVQGNGIDVGAALMSSGGLTELHIHGGPDTISRAKRAASRVSAAVNTLSGGGNTAVVHPEFNPDDLTELVQAVVPGVRMNNAGGPFAIQTLAVHSSIDDSVVATIVSALTTTTAAPLPTDALRQRAIKRIVDLRRSGAQVLLGGESTPDDVAHRMGWRMPPAVVDLGDAQQASELLKATGEPLGPVLMVTHWTEPSQLESLFDPQRYGDAYASEWGGQSLAIERTFGVAVRNQSPVEAASEGVIPSAWMGTANS